MVKANSDGQTDAELFAAGRRARYRNQCGSVIVGTGDGSSTGERNYHQCLEGTASHEVHTCGCGQEWRQGTEGQGMVSTGPLTDVVFPS